MIGIFVIDDHDIVHAGVQSVVANEEDMEYVGGASSLDEGLHRAALGVTDADELAALGQVLRVDVEERRERSVRMVRGFHGRVWWS